ncbi:MAG: High-affinity nickel transporter [Acidobacteriota bacterium]
MEHSVWIAALAGLAAGLIHALSGPDHLSAVAPLVVAGERRKSWRTGLFWGIGHSVGVWLMGLLAFALREVLPLERVSSWSERLVGATLIAVGLWGLRKAFAPRLEGEAHAHSHPRRPGSAALWIGSLHGLAGSSHILGLFPALAFGSRSASLAYIGGFGLGAIVAMVAFAAALGLASVRLTAGGGRGYQALLGGASAISIVLGGFWLVS